MATQYPDGIDSTSSLPYVTNGTSPMVGDDVNRLRDAIVAVETELGINPSGTFTSVDARLGEAEAAIAGYANSTFLVLSADGFVSQERVFSPSVNFDVVDGGAGANFEIDLAANVGIGTITPASDYSLTLDGDGATRIGGVTLRNTGTDTFYIGSATASDSANISLMNPNVGYVTLGTDGTERIRITSTGDVGLGTSLPAGRLHVSGGDLLVDTGDVGIGTVSPAGRLHVSGGDLLVDTGDVGIGTLTPSERLHVSGGNLLLESAAGAGLPYATMKGTQGGFQMSSGNGIGKLDVLDSTGAVTISLLNNVDNRLVGVNNADFSFYTNNTEKMRITAGGDLLVNSTANPDLARLHISGGGITHSSSQFNARPGAGVNYEWVNRDGAGHTWYVDSASTQAMTLTSAGNFGIGTSLPVSQFSVGSSSEFRVDSSGDITRISDVPYTFPVTQGVASSVLKNNGSGSLDWSLLADTEIVGGLQTVADITARDDIPSDRRKEGMLSYSQADDRHFVLEGGLTNSDWKEFGDDNRLVGGLQTVADTAARDDIPVAKRKEGMIVYSQADDRHFVLEGGIWVEAFTDTYIKGGLRVVADLAALETIPSRLQTAGMLVLTADTRDVYALQTPAAPPIPAANWRLLFRATGTSSAGVPRGRIQLDELGVATSTDNPPDDHAKVSLREMRALRLSMLSTSGEPCSRVLTGCALTPIFGATHPLGRLNPGTILLPNDIVAMIDELDVDLGLNSGYVEGAIPGAYPCNVYIFVRMKAGEFSAVLRASVTPPTHLGRLGVTPAGAEGAAYATSDYGYVGMLRPIAATGVNYAAVFGSGYSGDLGNGLRIVVFDRINADAFLDGVIASVGLGLSPGSPVSTVVAGPTGNPDTKFPTACELLVEEILSLDNLLSGGGGASVVVRALTAGTHSFMRYDLVETLPKTTQQRVRMPTVKTRPNVRLTASFAGGSAPYAVSVTHQLTYGGIVENVNKPRPVLQDDYGI